MIASCAYLCRAVGAAALLLGLPATPAHAVILFQETSLVSDGFVPANTVDPDLINPWGVSFSPTSPFWVSDNGAGVATLYNGAGGKIDINPPAGNVIVPPPRGQTFTSAPTGQVFNGTSDGFVLPDGKPANFIFVTEDGTISGWNRAAGTTAQLVIDNSKTGPGAVYKGLAIDNAGGHIFATNFRAGVVEEYNSSFGLVKTFTDATLPAGYAPFNARVLNGQLYVTFALQNAAKHDDIAGQGHGFLDVFDLNGNFVKRLISMGDLNSPWGLEIAPSNFGQLSGSLLVGNFGNGIIGAYDKTTGAFLGVLRDTHFNPLRFGDLWDLTLGNGAAGGNLDTLYFTAGVLNEAHGLFGSITALNVPEPATALILLAGLGGLAIARRRA